MKRISVVSLVALLLLVAPLAATARVLDDLPDVGPVEATGALTTVTYTVDSSLTCDPASGSQFPVGTTTVTCTSSDGTTTETFTVTVQDTTAPTLNVPANQTVEATSASGASVNFTVTATDAVDPSPTVTCDHSSGETFPVGTTTVTCSAADHNDPPNTASGSFTITVQEVQDKTAPVLTLPPSQTVNATSSAGAVVTWAAPSATDNVDGSVPVSCDHDSGSTFPVGTTTVNCSATDHAGNTGTGSFTVTVNALDNPPVLSNVPGPIQREANGPQGSVVTYSTPTAVDDIDGPIPTVNCAPASGSVFPLGTTTVSCQATDSHGNVGSATFQVRIVDTTPPVLTVPGNRTVHATSAAGIASAFFTNLASASDIVDPHPHISSNAPDIAPVGKTVVSFTATDASGNSTTGTSTLTVLPVGDTTPLPPAPDVRPPDDVRNLKAKAGDRLVVLSWDRPAAKDVKSFVVTRSVNQGTSARVLADTGAASVVYQGSATTFTDRRLTNGVDYRYIVVTIDSAGNKSPGAVVTAMPKRNPLRRPTDGSQLRRKKVRLVKLDWDNAPKASYYNLQLFYGTVKVLSAWPTASAYALHASWRYLSHRYQLKPGLYHWYVWPGYGSRSAVNYGPMLGSSSFVIKP